MDCLNQIVSIGKVVEVVPEQQGFFLKKLATISQFNTGFIRKKNLAPWNPDQVTNFLLLVTLNENNWVTKCIDWFCVFYLDCLKNVE